jgi:hypothetical protein
MEGSTAASGNSTEIKPSKPLLSNILITASVTVQATSHLTAVIVIVAEGQAMTLLQSGTIKLCVLSILWLERL